MLIDTHAHYDDKRFNGDRDEIIAAVKKSGVDIIINSGADVKSSESSFKLTKKYDFIYATAGVHPHDTEHTPENTVQILADLLGNKKVVAVGEIGLDFYHNFSNREAQKYWFKKQLDFASDINYPVVVHNRDAHSETLELIRKYNNLKGVFHCFSGDAEMARELTKLGYMMSFGGAVTFKNNKTCAEVLKAIPVEYILLETDCPYLAPHPKRGERNDSRNLMLIAEKIAGIKNMDTREFIAKTGENAVRCFGLDNLS
ncbi:MAG: TatD family hydrolase [Oscillospiraceae bacterium]|nr:TatD family hydrolase [Oscillospiraceae bacterium]